MTRATSKATTPPRARKARKSTRAKVTAPTTNKKTRKSTRAKVTAPTTNKKAVPSPSDLVSTPKDRALWAMYSGPFKLTPEYTADPVNAFPFQGRGFMTQKMDGMYMLWDGESQMYNRGRGSNARGNRAQHPPPQFIKHLPPVELEGELCYSSGEYSRGHAAKNNGWQHACLWVFDAPQHKGSFAERWQYLNRLLADYDPRYVRPVPFLGMATSRRVIDATLAKVRATTVARKYGRDGLVGAAYEGGEGVMVRDPGAPYTYSCFEPRHHGHKKGQTNALYKWLEEYGNDECLVLGPCLERANSLRVSLPNGVEFDLTSISLLGTPAAQVSAGSVITFTYRGWARGLPLNPCAQALRTDRPWSDIVANFIQPPAMNCGLAVPI